MIRQLSYEEQLIIIDAVLHKYKNCTSIPRQSTGKRSVGLCVHFKDTLECVYGDEVPLRKIQDYIPLFSYENAKKYGAATGAEFFYWWVTLTTIDPLDYIAPRVKFLEWMKAELQYKQAHPIRAFLRELFT